MTQGATFRGTPLPQDAITLLERALRTLSVALGVYAAAAMVAAISASFGVMEASLPFRDPAAARVSHVVEVGFSVSMFLDFGALIALLAGSADLIRAGEMAPQPLMGVVEGHRVVVFASLGLSFAGVPFLNLSLSRCLDCGPAVPFAVGQVGVILLGAGAILLTFALLRIALCFTEGRQAAVAVVGASLGAISVIGDIGSAFLFLSGDWARIGWIAFGGFPLVNWNPAWGSIGALGSGLMAWSYRRTPEVKVTPATPRTNSHQSGG